MSGRTFYPTLNEECWEQIKADLGLSKDVTIKLDHATTVVNDCSYVAGEALIYGRYNHLTNTVTLFVGHDRFRTMKLSQLKRTLVVTALHEIRHAWQYQNWTLEQYSQDQLVEPDACNWSELHAMKYIRLIDLNSKVKSSLSRLSAAEERIR